MGQSGARPTPDPAERRCNLFQPGMLERMRPRSRSTADPLRQRPLRGGSEVWTAEVPAPAPPPPRPRLRPWLTRTGCFLPLSVQVGRLRRPPAFHGKEGGAHRLGAPGGRESGQSQRRGAKGRQKGGGRVRGCRGREEALGE